jgi:outer membrane cobalamin receptor
MKSKKIVTALVLAVGVFTGRANATIFGTVKGIIHDPQHRPVADAQLVLRAASSQFMVTSNTNQDGDFIFSAVPIGDYVLTATAPGFAEVQRKVRVSSGSAIDLHLALNLPAVSQEVEVSAAPEIVDPQSTTTQTVVNREQIAETPGGDRSNSLSMITDYVPGAYMVHDQLHLRGGHQVSWLLDGVPVPNTNIASNVGPQFDPKDIDYVEFQRGGYSAAFGDRTYGVFNVVTRSGFERNNQGEVVLGYGSFNSSNDQINFGSHTDRFAYYASLSGNRTDLGLETPSTAVLHDAASGESGFTSLIFNASPADQLRLVASLRADHYQVPNDPAQQAMGTRDVEDEDDDFANFSWVHTLKQGMVLTVSPFYHFNRAHYRGGVLDTPVIPEDDRGSNYIGGQATLAVVAGKHNASFGGEVFGQRDNHLFSLESNDPSLASARQRQTLWGNLEAIFLEDQYKATSWLTLNGGVRLTRFSGALTETAADPRIGAAVRIPHLGWVLRGFYGRYYQAPPLTTLSGPFANLALDQGFGFLPLRGERDEQHEFALAIPYRGWALELNHFRTGAKNFFDHDVLGNSNIFFPVTLSRARIRGWEASLNSPRIAGRVQMHLAYSRQYAQGRGGVSGGLTDFTPPGADYFFLDHDQRDTLSTGVQSSLPWKSWASANFSYGSGFLDGNGPGHLPSHFISDLSLGKAWGESWSVRLDGLNLSNHHYLLDNSNTFGGTHFADPRRVEVQLRYRFHY